MLVLARADPAITRHRALRAIAAMLVPSIVLYLLWRAFVLNSGFTAGELKPLAFADWNIALLPQIVVALLVAMFRKATFFLFVAALLAFAGRRLRRDPWSREGRLLGMIAGVVILFNGFLLFTMSRISRPSGRWAHIHTSATTLGSPSWSCLGWWSNCGPGPRHGGGETRACGPAGRAAVGLALLFPVAGVPLLRFDRGTPQPELRRLGREAAAYLQPGDRLALLLPRDSEDSIGSFLRGVMLFTPPRRPGLEFRIETSVSLATLASVAAADYRLALVTCAPAGLDGVRPAMPQCCSHAGWLACPANLGVARADQAPAFAGLLARTHYAPARDQDEPPTTLRGEQIDVLTGDRTTVTAVLGLDPRIARQHTVWCRNPDGRGWPTQGMSEAGLPLDRRPAMTMGR